MQTIYYSTTNFIQHRGNLVDLDEFRWKLARARGEEQPDREEEPPFFNIICSLHTSIFRIETPVREISATARPTASPLAMRCDCTR